MTVFLDRFELGHPLVKAVFKFVSIAQLTNPIQIIDQVLLMQLEILLEIKHLLLGQFQLLMRWFHYLVHDRSQAVFIVEVVCRRQLLIHDLL